MSALPVQNGRIKKNKGGVNRYVGDVTLHEPEFGVSVRTARAVRTEMSKEEVTVANVRDASTLTLPRIRARNIRSVYERLWRCHLDGVKVPFLYDSKEGDGEDDSRTKEVRDYVAQHVRMLENLRAKVERSPRSKAAWKKCNKDGCSRKRMLLERDAAVVQELSRRDQEGADVARAPEASNRLEHSTPVVLYPKQYAADVARIQKELDAEYHGAYKPSRGEKLVAARANTLERGEMEAVASVDATITKRQATRRAARNREKARKAAEVAQMRDHAFQNRTPDPLSDDERSLSVLIDRILRNLESRHWLPSFPCKAIMNVHNSIKL